VFRRNVLLRKPGDYNAPEKRINIDGGSQMRRRIEVFKENVNTSFFFLDSFFSSLPLLTAKCIISADLYKTKKIETTDYTDFTDFFKFFLSVLLYFNFLFLLQQFLYDSLVNVF
jgi:hypothetical protein